MISPMTLASRDIQNYYIVYLRDGATIFISTIVSTQKFTAIAPIIRVNATFLLVYRLRTSKDLGTCLEELSAMLPRKELI